MSNHLTGPPEYLPHTICFFFEKQQNVRNKALLFIYKGTITETVKVTKRLK